MACEKEIPQEQLGPEQKGWRTFCVRPKDHSGECSMELDDAK